LPDNVDFGHFNAIAGQNAWKEAALLIVVGRTLPPPADVEAIARPLFGADIDEIEPGTWYPLVERGVQMRDGAIAKFEGHAHPDPRAEEVRWQICEAGLIQAIGRGRAINRTAANPLQIDILTNVPLPVVTDELVSWDVIQPTKAEIMRSRGAVPLNYRDMAAAYPDLFRKGAEAARKALGEENPGEMPIEEYLIGVSPGFLAIDYRRSGSRGPASTLLFDPNRIEPLAWLTERIGAVEIKGTARPLPISFKEYLQQRRLTDTPNGTFVEDAQHDRMLPDVRTWEQLESYLRGRGACDGALAAGRSVWGQYVAKHRSDRAGKAE
jgi:putative DNA primase/helicase